MMGTTTIIIAQRGGQADPQEIVAAFLCFGIIILVPAIILITSWWVLFQKADEPGWAAIVPFYNMVVLLRIAGKPGWWVILMLIPFVNIVISIMVAIALAEKFGQGGGFAVGLILLPFIFYPILAFGSSEYEGGRRRRLRRQEDDEEEEYERRPRRRPDDDDDDEPRPRRRRLPEN